MANSPARAAIDVGSVIADTYKIEALLGRGGMGAVFLASHRRLAGKQVAIKVLHTELEDADIVARFRREAEIAARLNHPNIVGVIDYNVAPDGTPYLVLDYLEGETLAQRIDRGPLPLDQVMSIVRQVGSAVAAAHRAGIVHRDLKPQNIFLVPTEVDGRVVEIAKVLDFGISKIRGSQTVKTQDSALLGTPQYMAPEQATGQHASVDERTDVFAFGAIVYEMLTGQPAFSGASIPAVVFKVVYEQPAPLIEQAPSVPPAVATAVSQAMAKQSGDRFPTIAAFVEAVTGQPLTLVRGQPPAPADAAGPPSASRRVATGEAFAQTMGSGDHGESPIGPLATAPGPTAGGRRAAGTAPSHAPAVATPSVEQPAGKLGEPRRRSSGVIAAVAIAGAVAAAVVVYLVMRNRGVPPVHRPDDLLVTAGSADHRTRTDARPAVAGTAAGSPAPVASGSGSGDASGSDAVDAKVSASGGPGPARGPDAGGAPVRQIRDDHRSGGKPILHGATPATPDTADDVDARAKLVQAEAALGRHEYDLAERAASAVINSTASARQRATARLVHGTVQCAARNDQEAAQIDLRNLDGFRGLKARLIAACQSHGIQLAP